jgi:hypothetical protein
MSDPHDPPRDDLSDLPIRGGRVVSVFSGEQLAADAQVR